MSLHVRPAAIVGAPLEVVWDLAQPAHWDRWIDGQLAPPVPEGPATAGQTFTVIAHALGRKVPCVFIVLHLNHDTHQLELSASFPLGIQVYPHFSCMPLDGASCRVQYEEEVVFPSAWWGKVLRLLGAKFFVAGIEDSLQRLKAAAETAYRNQGNRT